MARAIEVRGQAVADYFISEVLDQQPSEIAQFMLDTSILTGVLTADACAAVTGRQDAAALLRAIDRGHLFLVVLDDERSQFPVPPSGAPGAARRAARQRPVP